MSSDRRTVLTLIGAAMASGAGCLSGMGWREGDSVFDEYDAPTFPQTDFVTDPTISSAVAADQVRGNIDFSLALLDQLRDGVADDENLFVSPYSVSVALAMTYAGARGETAAEMAAALRYDLEDDDLHAAFGALETELEQRNRDGQEVEQHGAEDSDETDALGYQLSSANAVWAAKEFPFADDYLDLLEAYYEAGDHTVDFAGDPDEAREEINAWVEAQTNDRIEDLLPEELINASTQLVLTNAVYFLAAWEHDFDPDGTEPAPFTGLDGTESEVEMMHQSTQLRYADIGGHQLVELPYANDDTSMVVILPAEGEFESFEASLTADRLAIMLDEATYPVVDLALPKFGIESKFDLRNVLGELGMERAFDGASADFSGMLEDDDSDLSITSVIHETFIEVDEEGTEAAAATAVVMGGDDDGGQPDSVSMTVDRPFLFYIRDQPTETPLFLGRVVNGETFDD
ncbi:serpin family protein [Natrialba hulunbeirensis]|nr:serpin family protein [Natrialba hulunbeirensis]